MSKFVSKETSNLFRKNAKIILLLLDLNTGDYAKEFHCSRNYASKILGLDTKMQEKTFYKHITTLTNLVKLHRPSYDKKPSVAFSVNILLSNIETTYNKELYGLS